MRIYKQYSVNSTGLFDSATYLEVALDSTETKPAGNLADGSVCLETDTGKVFFYNENSASWVEQFSFQG